MRPSDRVELKAVLANGELELTVLPEFGARVTSLVDRRTGREWVVQGASVGSPGQDAIYSAEQAVGWDECFPTVSACTLPGGQRLRDHGALWGRPWQLDHSTDVAVSTTFRGEGYTFSRRITLNGPNVTCDYTVRNEATAPLLFLWAMHLLLGVTESDRIVLPEGTPCRWTYRSDDRPLGVSRWPEGASFPLDRIRPLSAAFAAKLQVQDTPARGVLVGDSNGALRIAGHGPMTRSVGLWLCYGGWPLGPHVHQIAPELTSAPADDIVTAEAMGCAAKVPAGGELKWRASLHIEPGI